MESIAYFCAAELLAGAVKHSGVSRVTVDATGGDGLLRLRVSDDGRGGARIGAGSGLTGLLARVRTVDGTLTCDSPPGPSSCRTPDTPDRSALHAGRVAEDPALLRDGLVQLLSLRGVETAAAVADPEALLAAVAEHAPRRRRGRHPAAAHGDRRGRTGGAAAARRAPRHGRAAVLAVRRDGACLPAARRPAGFGYLLKERVGDIGEFVNALERVAAGGTALDPEVVTALFGASRRTSAPDSLTSREREVLALMAEGRTNQHAVLRRRLARVAGERSFLLRACSRSPYPARQRVDGDD
ncbi:hypothetical protein GCM10009601_44490 [Streptomyces thermospinosisporus]|uniref:histidine kinase n=1 Tax=Streptomyces thermospinosisporus TaxID=161482 RepID=A0ABN1Z6A7_9ACTN